MPRLSDKPAKATPTASDQITIIDVADSDAVKLATFADAPISTAQASVNATKAPLAAPAFTGNATFDTDTLVVDSVNNRVGLGTSSPARELEVEGSGNAYVRVTCGNDTGESGLELGDQSSGSVAGIKYDHTGNFMRIIGNNAEHLRLDASGNVGLGTSSPSERLSVLADSFGAAAIRRNSSSGGAALYFGNNTEDAGFIGGASGGGLSLGHFETGSPSTDVTLDASGNVLAGKTNADSGFTSGFEYASSVGYFTRVSGTALVINRKTDDGKLVGFRQDNTEHGSISISGSTTSYNTTSDHRLKGGVVPMTGALARVDALKPSRFHFLKNPDREVDGFIAHEVQEVVPEAVTGEKDAMKTESFIATPALGDIYTPAVHAVLDEEGNELEAAIDEIIHDSGVEKPDELADGVQWRETQAAVMGEKEVEDYQGIDQSKLSPVIVGAVQELHVLVKSQSDLINDLTTRIAALEA